jgi:adenine deaminase
MSTFRIRGNVVDPLARSVTASEIEVAGGRILSVTPLAGPSPDPSLPYLAPGFVDAHVHIESSMLIPSEFARLAVVHGTVATVSDPHEIANVCGMEGVRFMVDNGRSVPFKFCFGAPSCVPATAFETAGAALGPDEVAELLSWPEIGYLSEMMDFPGAIAGHPDILAKITSARAAGKPVDGHAPGLRGEDLRRYAARGISTDHECFSLDEAREKASLGMHILIREGSAARNFEALHPLLAECHEQVMFCSDDKHPDSLVDGHINTLCARAVSLGHDPFHALRAACVNPALHYRLPVGLLRPGDPADFVLLEDLRSFRVLATWVDGCVVAEQGVSAIPRGIPPAPVNRFVPPALSLDDLVIPAEGPSYPYPVIGCQDGQLITDRVDLQPALREGQWSSDTGTDVLKIVVANRYWAASVAKAFVHRFGLREGAIASSVAHDSHNIIAVGVSDEDILRAIRLVSEHHGGVSCVCGGREMVVPLPVAGLMSTEVGHAVAEAYAGIDRMAKELGSSLGAPFMSLSFMALLVIPHVKLSDRGLFDGDRFAFF